MKVGDIVPLAIEKPAVGGRMIARLNGAVVLVAGAIPGERVRAQIERLGKGMAYADAVGIDEPSADRQATITDLACGGCLYGHIAYDRQLSLKSEVVADAFGRIGRIQLPSVVQVTASPNEGYRMRARLHLRRHRIGFFREGTHDICDARQTRQLLPASCDVLDRLNAAVRSLGVTAIRELELSENVDATERVVALDADRVIDRRTIERLAATEGLTGLVSAFAVHGSAHVTDRLTTGEGDSVSLRRHVHAFFQGNRYLLAALTAHVADQVIAGGEVLDLYAGAGVFALAVGASRDAHVIAVEGDRVGASDLAHNASTAGGRVTAVRQSVEAFLASATARLPPPATVIVDPPRTGMSREALDGVVRLRPARIVYVSCDVATLARDSRRIIEHGYAIARADAFDLFPNTPHVETVVVFDRPQEDGPAKAGPYVRVIGTPIRT